LKTGWATGPCRSAGQRSQNASVPHISLIEPGDATGALAKEYDAAIGRAGKVFNIVKAMSPNPTVLKRSMELYKCVMMGPSELSRVERELLAVVVSRENDCHY
jgi:alkylhydroperoxidase family enzyme